MRAGRTNAKKVGVGPPFPRWRMPACAVRQQARCTPLGWLGMEIPHRPCAPSLDRGLPPAPPHNHARAHKLWTARRADARLPASAALARTPPHAARQIWLAQPPTHPSRRLQKTPAAIRRRRRRPDPRPRRRRPQGVGTSPERSPRGAPGGTGAAGGRGVARGASAGGGPAAGARPGQGPPREAVGRGPPAARRGPRARSGPLAPRAARGEAGRNRQPPAPRGPRSPGDSGPPGVACGAAAGRPFGVQ